jgi:hypothetical protein
MERIRTRQAPLPPAVSAARAGPNPQTHFYFPYERPTSPSSLAALSRPLALARAACSAAPLPHDAARAACSRRCSACRRAQLSCCCARRLCLQGLPASFALSPPFLSSTAPLFGAGRPHRIAPPLVTGGPPRPRVVAFRRAAASTSQKPPTSSCRGTAVVFFLHRVSSELRGPGHSRRRGASSSAASTASRAVVAEPSPWRSAASSTLRCSSHRPSFSPLLLRAAEQPSAGATSPSSSSPAASEVHHQRHPSSAGETSPVFLPAFPWCYAPRCHGERMQHAQRRRSLKLLS